MNHEQATWLTLLVIVLAVLGGLDWAYELTHPGEDIIDAVTVGAAAVLGYRIGRSANY